MDVLNEWTPPPGTVDIPGLCLAYRARLTSASSSQLDASQNQGQ